MRRSLRPSFQDLDMIVNRAREVQTYEAEAGDDDTIVDDMTDGVIGTCKNFIEQYVQPFYHIGFV